MKRFVTLLCLGVIGLATLVAGFSFAPTTYAASLHPQRPFSGGPCTSPYPINTAISYDANSYTVKYDYNDGAIPYGFFGNTTSGAPALGASSCWGDTLGTFALYVGSTNSLASYNIRATINGVTTQMVPSSASVCTNCAGDGVTQIELFASSFAVATNHQYTFQVQFCLPLFPSGQTCSAWSPSVILTAAANRDCQSGYVWRAAAVFDLVCVTPAQRTQVANDNSQASVRVNPNGAYGPYTCISGYVWRNAFGGDYVCVTPNERTQVASDNSQALNRIVTL